MILIYNGPFDPTLTDGVSSTMFDLLSLIQRQGGEVAVVALMQDNSLTQDLLHSRIPSIGRQFASEGDHACRFLLDEIEVYYEVLPLGRHQVLRNHPLAMKRNLEVMKRFPNSLVITTDHDFTSLTARAISGRPAAHYILSPWSSIQAYKLSPMQLDILRKTTTFSISDYVRDQLRVDLGVGSSIWSQVISPDRFLSEDLDRTKFRVGYYSAGKHKGDRVVNALIEEMPQVEFVVIGRNFNAKHRNLDNVDFWGDTTDVTKFYGRLSLLLVPSQIPEGFSRVIIEAAMNGVPAIASNSGGIPEAMGGAGILIDPEQSISGQVNDYKEAIEGFINDSDRYRRYSQLARDRANRYQEDVLRQTKENIAALSG